MKRRQLTQEAALFGRHLIHQPIDATVAGRYADVIAAHSPALENSQARLVAYAGRHPHQLPYLDAYCALFKPQDELRRRLFVLFALLESTPAYTTSFLPQKRPVWYLLVLAAKGVRAIWRLFAGLVVYQFARRSAA